MLQPVSFINQDIHWQQRCSNYRKALKKLSSAIDMVDSKNVQAINDILSAYNNESKTAVEDVLKEGLI
jgi:hypothetical protein